MGLCYRDDFLADQPTDRYGKEPHPGPREGRDSEIHRDSELLSHSAKGGGHDVMVSRLYSAGAAADDWPGNYFLFARAHLQCLGEDARLMTVMGGAICDRCCQHLSRLCV